jgi:CheY-like chemotaxis protein
MANETILIAEDNRLNRKLVETVLRPHGYRLLLAATGQETIEMANSERPDVILMDIQLPDMDGYDATRILKSKPATAHIPVIALTAQAMEGDRERALEAGCAGYIAKPIDTRSLPGEVRQLLESRPSDSEHA